VLFTANTNIFKQLKTDGKRFCGICRGEEGRAGEWKEGGGVKKPYLHLRGTGNYSGNATTLIYILFNFQLSNYILKLDKAQGSD